MPLTVKLSYACPASWEAMAGDDRVRFCGLCRKSVYNLSELTEEEGRQLLSSRDAACATFYERADGTVVSAPCPTALGAARRKAADAAARWIGGGLAVAALAAGGVHAAGLDQPGAAARVARTLPLIGAALRLLDPGPPPEPQAKKAGEAHRRPLGIVNFASQSQPPK